MSNTRAVIIDDEDHVRENLRKILSSEFKDIEIIGEGNSVKSAVKLILEVNPDLVFLDIDLSDGSGFNVLEKIKNKAIGIIFITAYNNYAIKAFRYNALDYLLKPISTSELKEALDKFKHKNYTSLLSEEYLRITLDNLQKKDEDKKLIVRNSTTVSYINVPDIVRCEADGNYTTIFLTNGKKVVASKPLKEYVNLLPESLFFRIHQSHLIRLELVAKYSNDDGSFIVMSDNTILPIARRRKEAFFSRMEELV